MISPNRKALARWSEVCRPGTSLLQGTLHPNPRLYKHLYQIYTADYPWEDACFFAHAPMLCIHDAMQEMKALAAAGIHHIVYVHRLPRRGKATPFAPDSERWRDRTFACAYEEDNDTAWGEFR